MVFWSKKLVLINRHIFTAIPFFAAGVGGDELLRGIKTSDGFRILSSISIMVQGLFASFIFIRNDVKNQQTWKCRNLVFFMVGAITGLMVGLTAYYPLTYELDNEQLRSRNKTRGIEDSDTKLSTNLNNGTNGTTDSELKVKIVSKLGFLIPELGLSILILINTIYGLSVRLVQERPPDWGDVDDEQRGETLEEMEAAGVLESHLVDASHD